MNREKVFGVLAKIENLGDIEIKCDTRVGTDVSWDDLKAYDAVLFRKDNVFRVRVREAYRHAGPWRTNGWMPTAPVRAVPESVTKSSSAPGFGAPTSVQAHVHEELDEWDAQLAMHADPDPLITWALVLVIVVIAKTAVVVPQQSAFVVEQLGKYSRTLEPGIHLLVPVVDHVRSKMDIREQVVGFVLLAATLGRGILRLSERDEVQYFVLALAVVSVAGSGLALLLVTLSGFFGGLGGMMLMATATDLLVIFIALEILSLAVYILTGIRRESKSGACLAMWLPTAPSDAQPSSSEAASMRRSFAASAQRSASTRAHSGFASGSTAARRSTGRRAPSGGR